MTSSPAYADNALSQQIQRPDVKQYINEFKKMDQKHLDNYQPMLFGNEMKTRNQAIDRARPCTA